MKIIVIKSTKNMGFWGKYSSCLD